MSMVSWMANYNTVHGSPQVSFTLGPYDQTKPLILSITPLVGAPSGPPAPGTHPEWGTYIDGPADDDITDLDHDASGNLYFTGYSRSEVGFPLTVGTHQEVNGGATDIIVGKFNEFYEIEVPGTWMTYLGEADDQEGRAVSYDPVNDGVAIVGEAFNNQLTNLALATNPNCFQGTGQGVVAFLSASPGGLSPGGELQYLTNYQLSLNMRDLDHDEFGNLYVVGDGPVQWFDADLVDPAGTADYFSFGGSEIDFNYNSGLLSKFDAAGNLVWATIFGGPGDDYVGSCHVDPVTDRLYVVGQTFSPGSTDPPCGPNISWDGFPICDGGGWYQPALNDGSNSSYNHSRTDAYITAFDLNTLGIVWSSFIGGFEPDEMATDVSTNSNGDIYVTGFTNSAVYNTLPCAWDATQFRFPYCPNGFNQPAGGGFDNFILRFDPSTALVMSSFIGGSGEESLPAEGGRPRISCDDQDNVFIFATTNSGSILYPNSLPAPMFNSPEFYLRGDHADATTSNILQSLDGYVVGFDPTNNQTYGSYVGSVGSDFSGGLDAFNGRVYISGSTHSTFAFPLDCPNLPNNTPYCDGSASASTTTTDAYLVQLRYSLNVGVDEAGQTPNDQLLLYPNPTTGQVMLNCSGGCIGATAAVFDATGRLVLTRSLSHGKNTIPTSGLAPGTYHVQLTTSEGIRRAGRLVKQ